MEYKTKIQITFTTKKQAGKFIRILDESELYPSQDDFGPSNLNNIIYYLQLENTIPASVNGCIDTVRQISNFVYLTITTKIDPGFDILYALSHIVDSNSTFKYTTTFETGSMTNSNHVRNKRAKYKTIEDITNLIPNLLHKITKQVIIPD